MRARLVGGLLGWLAAIVPLVAVNIANIVGIFDFGEMITWGAVALICGLLLGGILAGIFGGRSHAGASGGAIGGAGAGGVAALLFVVTVIVLVIGTSVMDSAPLLLQDQAVGVIGMLMGLVFIGVLLVAIAAVTGAVAGRGHEATETARGQGREQPSLRPTASGLPAMTTTRQKAYSTSDSTSQRRASRPHDNTDGRPRGGDSGPYAGSRARGQGRGRHEDGWR